MINPKTIERFLAQPIPAMPDFKGADAGALFRSIYDSTGCFFQPHTEPRHYQLEGIAFALYLREALLLYDMRMGKTMMALAWAEHLKAARLWRSGKGLIMAHSPIGLDVWLGEGLKHSGLKLRAVHTDPEDLLDALSDDTDLIVCPPSGLQEMFTTWGINRKGKRKLYPVMELLDEVASEISLAVFDEIHMYKDHLSLRFQMTAALTANCRFRLGLTGTPFGRDPMALWAQAFLVDRGNTLGHNYYFFEQAFGKPSKNWFSGRTEYKFEKRKLPMLEYKMSALSMSYRREEVADQTVWANSVNLRMYGDQLAAYNEAIDRVIKLDSGEHVEILNSFHRLRQISSGYLPFSDDDDEKHIVHFKANPKMDWLADLVSRHPSQVVIFHEYTHTGKLICEMLTKAKASFGWLYGGVTSHKQSNAIVRDFQSGKIQYLVANSVKGGMSIDLPQADLLVFYEINPSPIIYQQASARPMARGDRPLSIDHLLTSPVERRIMDFIREGKDIMGALSRLRRGFRERQTAAIPASPQPPKAPARPVGRRALPPSLRAS